MVNVELSACNDRDKLLIERTSVSFNIRLQIETGGNRVIILVYLRMESKTQRIGAAMIHLRLVNRMELTILTIIDGLHIITSKLTAHPFAIKHLQNSLNRSTGYEIGTIDSFHTHRWEAIAIASEEITQGLIVTQHAFHSLLESCKTYTERENVMRFGILRIQVGSTYWQVISDDIVVAWYSNGEPGVIFQFI